MSKIEHYHLLRMWDFSAVLVGILLAGASGYVGALVHNWVQLRRLRILEFDVSDLSNVIMREVKKRASSESLKKKDELDRVLEGIPDRQPEPTAWWDQFVHPDLKTRK